MGKRKIDLTQYLDEDEKDVVAKKSKKERKKERLEQEDAENIAPVDVDKTDSKQEAVKSKKAKKDKKKKRLEQADADDISPSAVDESEKEEIQEAKKSKKEKKRKRLEEQENAEDTILTADESDPVIVVKKSKKDRKKKHQDSEENSADVEAPESTEDVATVKKLKKDKKKKREQSEQETTAPVDSAESENTEGSSKAKKSKKDKKSDKNVTSTDADKSENTEGSDSEDEEAELRELTRNENFQSRLNYVNQLGAYSKGQVMEAIEDVQYDGGRCNHQYMELPEDGGIYNREGVPFHHTVSTELKPRHIARLAKHGIRLRQRGITRPEEEIIMKNWKKFAKEHSIADEDAYNYIGVCGFHRNAAERKEEKNWLRANNFLPRMCEGLLDRSAATVDRFLRSRFHPSVVNQSEVYRPWTKAEQEKLVHVIENDPGRNFEALAVEMGRTRMYLHAKKQQYLELKDAPEELNDQDRYKLYQQIKQLLRPEDPLKMVLTGNWKKALSKKSVTELACYMNRTEKTVQQEWLNIGYLMIQKHKEYRDHEDVTLRDIERKVFNMEFSLTIETFRECLTYLLELPVFLSLSKVNHARLTKWIASRGLNFATNKSTGQHIISKIQRALQQLTLCGYMDRLPLTVTIRDLLELLADLIDKKLFKWTFEESDKLVKKAIKKFAKVLRSRPEPTFVSEQ